MGSAHAERALGSGITTGSKTESVSERRCFTAGSAAACGRAEGVEPEGQRCSDSRGSG